MSEPMAYLNGRWLPQSQVALPLHDAGFVYGATVTDLCRTFHHRLYRAGDHLRRFEESCKLARVPMHVSAEELEDMAERLVGSNAALLGPGDELAIVVFATPGPVPHYASLPGGTREGPPTLGMHTFRLPFEHYSRMFVEGARLVVPSVRHTPAESVDPRIKQRSRLFWWLAEQEVRDADPNARPLLLDADGLVTETAAANVLVVRDGTVLTPRRERVLGGISLRVVEELCGELHIPFVEADLTLADCQGAGEMMLSGTSFCLAPIGSIHGTALPRTNPVFEQLLRAWSDRVGLDIRAQILAERPET